jgi:hypothetical protein
MPGVGPRDPIGRWVGRLYPTAGEGHAIFRTAREARPVGGGRVGGGASGDGLSADGVSADEFDGTARPTFSIGSGPFLHGTESRKESAP